MVRTAWYPICVMALVVNACAPAAPGQSQAPAGGARSAPSTQPQRTVVMALRLEPNTLALRPPRETFANIDHNRLFNADFATIDDRAVPQPYLVEAFPQLNTDTWQVQPDGRMRTTYRLRPNLSWHDGTPMSAADYVFSWRVYSHPDVGLSRQPPFDAIEGVAAPDARTLVIDWKRPNPDAAHMAGREVNYPALPRHVLESEFAPDNIEAFVNHPFWAREFMGLGPYREVTWEPGTFIEVVAFDGHATGRAKIERVRLVFIADRNTALANVLSGELQLTGPTVLGVEQAVTVEREWGPRQGGAVINQFFLWRGIYIQFLPAFQSPRALQDVRVRRALAHTVDKDTVNEASNSGLAVDADYYLPLTSKWGAAVERGAVKYLFDPRQSEQLMREAGYERGPDGFYAGADGRFMVQLATNSGGSGEQEVATLANDWQRAGFQIEQKIIPSALSLDVELRGSFPGLFVTTNRATERTAVSPIPGNIPMPANNWRGGSQTSWTNPTYTTLVGRFNASLVPDERADVLAQMARVFTEEVGGISLHFQPTPIAVVAALQGPKSGAPETNIWWNIPEWEIG